MATLGMVTRIGRRTPRRTFVREWREHRERTQEWLAEAIGTTKSTISKIERGAVRLDTVVMADIAYALGIDEADLFRHPSQPSADALLRDAPASVIANAVAIIETLKRSSSR